MIYEFIIRVKVGDELRRAFKSFSEVIKFLHNHRKVILMISVREEQTVKRGGEK